MSHFSHSWLPYLYQYGLGAVIFVVGLVITLRSGSFDLRRKVHRRWFGVLLFGQTLDLETGAVGGEIAFISWNNFIGPQPLEVVGPHQQWKIGELLDEFFVVPLLVDHQLGDAQPQRRIGLRTDRHPIVGLGARGPILGSDHHNSTAAFHALNEPVRVGHLVLDQVLAVHDDQLAEPQVVEVAVGGLQTVDPRVSRRLVAVPGVVAPVAAAPGLVGADISHVSVQKCHGVVEAVHAVLPDHAQ